MIEREIILLLRKISLQLEQVLKSQDDISDEILTLKKEINLFQNRAIKELEDKILSSDNLDLH